MHVHSHAGSSGHTDHRAHGAAPGCAASSSTPAGRERERRALRATLALGLIILVAEIVGGLVSGSLALLSDAAHVFSDTMAQAMALAALVLAQRPADSRRTYGWHRLEVLAALANAVILLALAAGLVWGAIQRFFNPVEIHAGTMLLVAVIGLAANVIGARLLHGSQSLNARGAYLHIVLDALSSVVVVAGGLVMWLWHAPAARRIDPALTIAIACFIVVHAYRLAGEAVHVLLEGVPTELELGRVAGAIDRVPGVCGVHDLHLWSLTSGVYALSAHVVVAEDRDPQHHDALLAAIKDTLRTEFAITHTTLQLESRTYTPSDGAPC